jgi:hypothetical protein
VHPPRNEWGEVPVNVEEGRIGKIDERMSPSPPRERNNARIVVLEREPPTRTGQGDLGHHLGFM